MLHHTVAWCSPSNHPFLSIAWSVLLIHVQPNTFKLDLPLERPHSYLSTSMVLADPQNKTDTPLQLHDRRLDWSGLPRTAACCCPVRHMTDCVVITMDHRLSTWRSCAVIADVTINSLQWKTLKKFLILDSSVLTREHKKYFWKFSFFLDVTVQDHVHVKMIGLKFLYLYFVYGSEVQRLIT